MKIQNYFSVLFFTILVFTSCSQEDEELLPPAVFVNMEVSSSMSFIDAPISVIIEGTGYSSVEIVSNKGSEITIAELSENIFEISAEHSLTAKIYITLKNENDERSDTKSFDLNFYEHGVKNYNTIEGIKINVDKKDKLIALLGEPEGRFLSTSGNGEFLYYFTKGVWFFVKEGTEIVDYCRFYGITWSRTIDGIVKEGVIYPYTIEGLGDFNDPQGVNMNTVVSKFGSVSPNSKYSSTSENSTLRWYIYPSSDNKNAISFYFWADTVDAYQLERVPYINLY